MKKKFLTLIVVTIMLTICLLAGCASGHKEPIIPDENTVVISIEKGDLNGEELSLSAYMDILKEEGKLDYTSSNGMITSLNGIDNASDYSSCWMLYTSDDENANEAWGTVVYDGSNYASSMYGADELKVKEGCLYIWAYITF